VQSLYNGKKNSNRFEFVTTAGYVAKDYQISKPHFKVQQLLEHRSITSTSYLMLIDFGLKRILHMRGLTCNSNYLRAISDFTRGKLRKEIRQVKS
jgi:hypothetical protein